MHRWVRFDKGFRKYPVLQDLTPCVMLNAAQASLRETIAPSTGLMRTDGHPLGYLSIVQTTVGE